MHGRGGRLRGEILAWEWWPLAGGDPCLALAALTDNSAQGCMLQGVSLTCLLHLLEVVHAFLVSGVSCVCVCVCVCVYVCVCMCVYVCMFHYVCTPRHCTRSSVRLCESV